MDAPARNPRALRSEGRRPSNELAGVPTRPILILTKKVAMSLHTASWVAVNDEYVALVSKAAR